MNESSMKCAKYDSFFSIHVRGRTTLCRGDRMLSCEGADFSKVLKRYDIDLQVEMTPQEMAAKLLPQDPVFHKVAEEVMYMRFKTVGPVVAEAIKERDPLDVINNGLVAGMEIVAKLYAEHVYYLPEIMMAAKTMEIGIAIAETRNRSPAEGRPKPPSSCTLPRETPTTSERTSPLS